MTDDIKYWLDREQEGLDTMWDYLEAREKINIF